MTSFNLRNASLRVGKRQMQEWWRKPQTDCGGAVQAIICVSEFALTRVYGQARCHKPPRPWQVFPSGAG